MVPGPASASLFPYPAVLRSVLGSPPVLTVGTVAACFQTEALAQAAVQAASSAHDAFIVTLTPIATAKSDSNPSLPTFTLTVTHCPPNPPPPHMPAYLFPPPP